MSRSLDTSRPFRAGRHRAEAAQTPATTSPDADATNVQPAPSEQTSPALRRRRDRRPAFEAPRPPETAPIAKTAAPVTEALPVAAPTDSAAPKAARRRGTVTALSPQISDAFRSDPAAVLRNAASVRVMGHRMAVVTGALAVLLAVGSASQATELPFFGKESSAQDAPGATQAAQGPPPANVAGRPTPLPTASSPSPGTSGSAPAPPAAGTSDVPAVASPVATDLPSIADLPMPVDAPTLAAIEAATSAAGPAASTPSGPQPSANSTATSNAPTAPAPVPARTPAAQAIAPATSPASPTATPAPTTAPAPLAASPAPSPTTATPSAAGDDTTDEPVDVRNYASARLASYGWGPEQMNALNALWDTATKWRPSQVERGLSYIKKSYGSPAKALEFRAAHKWY